MERGVRIAPDLVAWAGARAAEALHHAHEATDESGARLGLVHRDVSPQNLFVTYDGQVKVIDFGIARAEGRLVQTGHGKIRGKFRYMAPEQLLGRDVDRRADLFALGATLYEAAVGQPVFAGGEETDVLQALLLGEVPDPRVRAPDVPPALSRLLLRALAGDPADRPQTGAELARELDAVAAASGRTDQQARIAALLGEMFVEEREQRAHAIAQLREPAANEGDPGSVLRLAAPPAADGAENTVLLTTLRPRASRLGQVALAAAVLVALASAAFVLASRVRHAPTAAAPPVAQSIALDVRVQPPVEATIRIGGRVVDQRPAREMLARATAPVQIEVTAPG
jgi:serine/threonine-protein kinase